ncbi:hypothetical protein FOL46_007208 [Perkinsus olseni]|uniref:Uncharacterized protein n=1 Tax=Perkinsus olseni TaxID=32597 RepID=A0A7J6MXJ5_PEROL|nr:hypothetical protein FOL46_007208 [Perkinsus olseni]
MDPFLCSTIALESAAVKSRFNRFDGARFLNDVGREVSAFLGKSSRELTFKCPSNTVILPDIWFMFIRRGVLMVAQYLEKGIALVPLFSPATAPHLHVASGSLTRLPVGRFHLSARGIERAIVFRRNLEGGGFLNDVGREVSAFLGKSSRELTFNCPSNTVMLPYISFMFIRRGVLMVAQSSKEGLSLVPLFSPATTPHLQIASAGGFMWGHCYDPLEDELYMLRSEENSFFLHVAR